jgi:hypothetical protein
MQVRVISTAILLMASIASASATVRIFDDLGGQIGDYLAKYQALRRSGDRVIIDGTCASACTMLLGLIPRSRICVTSRAALAFHSAWDPASGGSRVISRAGNRLLWLSYPRDVRDWIGRHGGLQPQIIYLRGAELSAIYPACH